MSGKKRLRNAMATCRVVAIPTRKKKIEDPKTHKEKEIQLSRIKELN